MSDAAETVRNALAKMTPGEWAHHTNALGGAIGQGAEWIRAFDEGGSWVIASLDFGTDESPSEQQIADAAGIVALKNHTPALLAELGAARAEVERLREALAWYAEQAKLCRLAHSGGDAGRHALQDDGGRRARAALEPHP